MNRNAPASTVVADVSPIRAEAATVRAVFSATAEPLGPGEFVNHARIRDILAAARGARQGIHLARRTAPPSRRPRHPHSSRTGRWMMPSTLRATPAWRSSQSGDVGIPTIRHTCEHTPGHARI